MEKYTHAASNESEPKFDSDCAASLNSSIDTPSNSSRIGWVCAIPFLLIAIIAFAIRTTSDVHTPPPTLQTSLGKPSKQLVPAASGLLKNGDRHLAPQRFRSDYQAPKEPGPVFQQAARLLETEPSVRVNVTPGGVDSFKLEVRGRCDVRSLESTKRLYENHELGNVIVCSTKSGLKLGSISLSANQIEIIPEKSPAIRVNGHLYRGSMRLFRRTDGKVSAVNVLPIEAYLASVVDSEMPAKFPEAARQAQAIVARTYALYQAEHADPKAVFDLRSSQRSQKYLGVEYLDSTGRRLAGESESSRQAVEKTRGMVCKYRNQLFCTYYSAVCGGQTTYGQSVFKDAVEVIRTVPCDWCRDSPHFRWTTETTRETFEKQALPQGELRKNAPSVRSIRQLVDPGVGEVSEFEIDTGRERQKVSGTELRERLPSGTLFSPHFHIRLEKNRVVFEGRGHGHGVGFCQWGAKGQAEEGRSSLDIVLYYYPGADISTIRY